jgi:hypothetical protein
MRFPVTVYKEDPEKTGFTEYHEVCYSFDVKARTFILLEKRGWWDNVKKESCLNSMVLGGPLKSEIDASAGMDARVENLKREGWAYKFTTLFDRTTGMLVPRRIS